MGYSDYQQSNLELREFYRIFNNSITLLTPGAVPPTPVSIGPFENKPSFSATVDEDVEFELKLPNKTLVEDELHFHIHYIQDAASAGDVVWELTYYVLDVLDQDVTALVGTTVTETVTPVNDPNKLQNTLSVSPWTLVIPVTGVLKSNGFVQCVLSRLGTDVGDTNTAEMVVMGVQPVLVKT